MIPKSPKGSQLQGELEKQVTSCHSSQSGSSSSTPDVLPPENHGDGLTCHPHAPAPGTIIPNRIFVGGIDYKINESDLRRVFSQHGAVKEVKIVIDRSGMSKGYGFVTFETQEDVLKILNDANGICFKEKKLCIGQAVRKHQTSGQTKNASLAQPQPAVPHQVPCGTLYLTTSTGYPYTYHNGVAYFHCPNINPAPHHWSPAPRLMLSQSHQPVHQQAAYHQYQSVPNHCQWNAVQVPSNAVVYSQQSEYLCQTADGGSFSPPVPFMEETTPEFVEPTLPHVYPGMTPVALQYDPGKNLMFPPPRVRLTPKYRRYMQHKDYHYLPESAESPDTSMFHTSQPLM
ncbi:protein boule-like [Odontesthes bonariensis]